MVKTEKENKKNILLALFIACLILVLNIGTTAKAEKTEADVIKRNEISGEIPGIIGYDEEAACEILWKNGFSYITAE